MDMLLMIDGSNLLFQMFLGMPARIVNSRGKAIHGTIGFIGALRKIVAMVNPTHLLVIFDGEDAGQRPLLDPGYKANRPDYSAIAEEETPYSQLADVCAALDCMGVRWMETNGCEADDIIAGYALSGEIGMPIVISSYDSDFFQLISDRVSVLRYRGKGSVKYTPDDIFARFGVQPDRYADFKAMVGDHADNIRGAEHIGPKTAAALLARFGSVQAVIEHADEIERASVRDSIKRNAGRLLLNLRLIRLSACVQLPVPLSMLAYAGCAMTTGEILERAGLK